jgi:hypothetical protein
MPTNKRLVFAKTMNIVLAVFAFLAAATFAVLFVTTKSDAVVLSSGALGVFATYEFVQCIKRHAKYAGYQHAGQS